MARAPISFFFMVPPEHLFTVHHSFGVGGHPFPSDRLSLSRYSHKI